MRRRFSLVLTLLTLALASLPGSALAQRRGPSNRGTGWAPVSIGIHGGYEYRASAYALGAQIRIPLHPSGYLELVPNGDVVFPPREKDYMVGADVVAISGGRRGGIYAGAGLTWRKALYEGVRDTKRAPTIVVGVKSSGLMGAPMSTQIEVRWIRVDTALKPKLLTLGFNLPLWGR